MSMVDLVDSSTTKHPYKWGQHQSPWQALNDAKQRESDVLTEKQRILVSFFFFVLWHLQIIVLMASTMNIL